MDKTNSYVIITPVRDEVNYVEYTVRSVVEQTITPSEWIIVDDGSTDGTDRLLDKITKDFPWIKVIHRIDRGFRAAGGGVVQAFYEGYQQISYSNWRYLVKLDGDLSFSKEYFERCFMVFDDNPKLGISGGTVCKIEDGKTLVDSVGDPLFHVRGATKIYQRECWEKIHPLIQAPGWDTIDEIKANCYGWQTKTLAELPIVQHKPTGGADGDWRNWYKNGVANYVTGYHPLFMLAKCLKRALKKPFLVEGMALFLGFCSGYLKKIPQVPDKVAIDYLRQQQMKRLLFKPSIYG